MTSTKATDEILRMLLVYLAATLQEERTIQRFQMSFVHGLVNLGGNSHTCALLRQQYSGAACAMRRTTVQNHPVLAERTARFTELGFPIRLTKGAHSHCLHSGNRAEYGPLFQTDNSHGDRVKKDSRSERISGFENLIIQSRNGESFDPYTVSDVVLKAAGIQNPKDSGSGTDASADHNCDGELAIFTDSLRQLYNHFEAAQSRMGRPH